jgi:hypothetical protein
MFENGEFRTGSVTFGLETTVLTVSKKQRSFRRSAAAEGTVDFRLSPLPPMCFR